MNATPTWVLSALLGTALVASAAAAQAPVIGPGREDEVMALFAPYGLGERVAPGWTLDSVELEPTRIRAIMRSDEGLASLTLEHPSNAPEGAVSSPSFAVIQEGDPRSQAARATLMRALRVNDRGDFWEGPSPRESHLFAPHQRASPLNLGRARGPGARGGRARAGPEAPSRVLSRAAEGWRREESWRSAPGGRHGIGVGPPDDVSTDAQCSSTRRMAGSSSSAISDVQGGKTSR